MPSATPHTRPVGGSYSGGLPGPGAGASPIQTAVGLRRGRGESVDAAEENAARTLLLSLQQERQQQQQSVGSAGLYGYLSPVGVNGEALGVIMQDRLLKITFYSLARHASTLIASRVTPKQKALLVKQNSAFNPRGTSLAIGDGANDVAMILAASVGVGIAGKEGLQAARAADFSIGDFKFLRKLLFVHGREALRRNCILVYTCIFRNAATCWSTLAMNFVCGFSGLDVWNPWTKQVLSIAFTCLPILAFVTMDRQVPHEILLENPVLYEVIPSTIWPYYSHPRITWLQKRLHAVFVRPVQRVVSSCWRHVCAPPLQRLLQQQKVDLSPLYAWAQHRKKPENDRCYGTHCLFVWLLYALWVAACELALLLYGSVGAWTPYVNKSEGFPSVQFDSFTQIIQLNYILVVNGVVALLSNTWTAIQVAVHVLESCAAVLFWLVVSYWRLFLSVVGAEVLHGTFVMVSITAPYYFALLVTVVACLLPLAVPMFWQYLRRPTLEQLIVEQLALHTYDRLDVRRGRPEGIAYVAVEASARRSAARRAAATMAAEAAAAAAAGEGAEEEAAKAERAAAAEAAAAQEAREGEEYTGFAFTQEPIFNILSGLQEAFRAVKRTGGGNRSSDVEPPDCTSLQHEQNIFASLQRDHVADTCSGGRRETCRRAPGLVKIEKLRRRQLKSKAKHCGNVNRGVVHC
ncbi:UNVERIFIED_CONTAM: hypothetical protein H355_016234 [Colinus virginianus]|nr:hypothetical protein H355_016234 [Colinus virginianus]